MRLEQVLSLERALDQKRLQLDQPQKAHLQAPARKQTPLSTAVDAGVRTALASCTARLPVAVCLWGVHKVSQRALCRLTACNCAAQQRRVPACPGSACRHRACHLVTHGTSIWTARCASCCMSGPSSPVPEGGAPHQYVISQVAHLPQMHP